MRKYAQRLAFWSLKQSLRLCRATGMFNPKGLAMDAAGSIGWFNRTPDGLAFEAAQELRIVN